MVDGGVQIKITGMKTKFKILAVKVSTYLNCNKKEMMRFMSLFLSEGADTYFTYQIGHSWFNFSIK